MSFYSRLYAIGWTGLGRLAFALIVVLIEESFRLILAVVPSRIVHFVRTRLARQFPSGKALWGDDENQCPTMEMSTNDLITHFGYPVEEHMVRTDDNYLLSLQRIPHSKTVHNATSMPRPAVLLMHGLMQNSEVWVCTEESLAYMLSESGFDVWLGNIRGNKYSCKHLNLKPHDSKFWDYSLDEMALYDLPAMINYILEITGNEKLNYVGFSQGTGAAFACFSLQPKIADRISMFVALAPAAKARGLKQGMLQTFVNMAPQSLFLILGTRAALAISLFWRSVLQRRLFTAVIDRSCKLLFGWRMANMGPFNRKARLYPHLFSLTSVKSVVHWLQIAACNRFQQYDENQNFQKGYRGILPQAYPISQIRCKMAMFYGGADLLTDVQWLLDELPADTLRERVDHYEHIDLIWAVDAHKKVFPKVVHVLHNVIREASPSPPSTAL